jgi:alanine dehydrogenase
MVMHRAAAAPSRRDRLIEAAGRFTGSLMRGAPGVAGAAAIVIGAGLIYRPAAFLVGGLFLILVDRRVP